MKFIHHKQERRLQQQREDQFREQEIDRDDQDRSDDDRLSGRTPDADCAARSAQSFVTTYDRDDESEDGRLDQTAQDFVVGHSLFRRRDVDRRRLPLKRHRRQHPAHGAGHVADDRQRGRHRHQRDDAWRDQFFNRVGAEGAHGVDLLADEHGAEFRRDARPDAARQHQTGQHRPEFADQTGRHELARNVLHAEFLKRVAGVERQHGPGEESRQQYDRQAAVAQRIHLPDHLAHVVRRPENPARHAPDEQGNFLYLDNSADDQIHLGSRSVIEIGAVRNAPLQRTHYDAVFAFAGQDKPGSRKGPCGESTSRKRRTRRLFWSFFVFFASSWLILILYRALPGRRDAT